MVVRKNKWWLSLAGVAALMAAGIAQDPANPVPANPEAAATAAEVATYTAYKRVVDDTAAMVSNPTAQQLAAKHGLQVLNVTWEDTGRYKGSSVGPNISDMTIQVQTMDPRNEQFQLACMPVIRFPNFEDKTADLPIDKFFLLVGNEHGSEHLHRVSLKDFLANIRDFLHTPDSWAGERKSLLADRDENVLVSAQACFLPVPQQGIAEFNPVLFNYQSYQGDPAVLTILCTRQGTSVTVIDNTRDGFAAGRTWGQRLFFNKNGERAVFTGQRLSDFNAEQSANDNGSNNQADPSVQVGGQEGLNMVLLIQVPLKQKNPMTFGDDANELSDGDVPQANEARRSLDNSDVEEAVIGHGRVEGPFTEIDNLDIQRDARFPIRVTVQFYKATSNGVVNEADMKAIAEQIQKVYAQSEYVGSLVTEGHTGRTTEYEGPKVEPPDWWAQFWNRHELNTGQTRADTMLMLRKLFGPNWTPRNNLELEEALRRLAEHEKQAAEEEKRD